MVTKQLARSDASKVYFREKAATVFKTRLSLKEKVKGFLTCRRRENAAGGLGSIVNHEI